MSIPFCFIRVATISASKRGRRAFTLIELLVVVAIIVALLAILLPSLGKSVMIAQSAKCSSVLRQVGFANLNYASDNHREFVYHQYAINGKTYEGTSYTNYWATDLAFVQYLGMTPKDVSNAWQTHPGAPFGSGFSAGVTWPDKFDCPNEADRKYWEGSYNWGHRIGIGYNIRASGHTISQVVNPAGKLQFSDGENWRMTIDSSDYRSWFAVGYITWGGWGGLIPRHNFSGEIGDEGDGANVAFFDGHVERLRKDQTFFYTAPTGWDADDDANLRLWEPTR